MLTTILSKIPLKNIIIATALVILLIGGWEWHTHALAKREAQYQADLVKKTQDHLDKVNALQGKIDLLGTEVSDREAKLKDANQRLTVALKKPLPPLPPIPPGVVDPCAEVRIAAAAREEVLQEQVTEAVAAKETAEAVLPPLHAQVTLLTQQKSEALLAVDNQKDLMKSLNLKLDKTEDSLHTWKVGGITLGVTGLVYLLVKH
jgi:peptidoglycan hydrolase CwlO-like protein